MSEKQSAARGKTQTDYIGFNVPRPLKRAARRKLGTRKGALTEYLIGCLERLRDGEEAAPRPAAEPLISEAQAARLLGLSAPTLRRMRLAGEISFIEIGERKLYDPIYLRTEFIPAHRRNGQEASGRE